LEGEQRIIWLDARKVGDSLSESQANTLVKLVAYYSPKAEATARAFKTYKEYVDFLQIA